MPMPTGGDGLAVEDRQVDAAGVHVLQDDRLGGDLDVLQLGQVGVRTAPEREDDLLAGRRRRRCRRARAAGLRVSGAGVVGVAHGQKATVVGLGGPGAHGGAGRGVRRAARGRGARASRASSRSSRRSSRLASRIEERTHWTNSTAKNSSPTASPELQRMPPASCWSAWALGQPGAHRAVVELGVPAAADQPVLGHDRDAHERVERQRQDGQQHPDRVGDPARAAGRRPSAARRTRQPTTHHVQVGHLVQVVVVQRRGVPPAEVERPRA